LGEVCLPRPLVRQSNGLVSCNVVWELPAQPPPGAPTPSRCEQLPFLGPVDSGGAPMNAANGMNCKVKQIAVTDLSSKTEPAGDGWYYDNFTDDLKKTCKPNQLQRVAFTSAAKPPTGVTVKLECLNETQKLANTRIDLAQAVPQPEIGTGCGGEVGTNKPMGDIACVVTLQNNTEDHSMFCHPDLNICVRSCTSDTDCPPAWVCDERPATLTGTQGKGAYCVNPTCGADTVTM
jgi:hypothetical protein